MMPLFYVDVVFSLLLYLVFFSTREAVGNVKNRGLHCSVSSQYNTPIDHYYRYPMEMFPEGSLSFLSEPPLYYECSSRNLHDKSDDIIKCVIDQTLCPITHENLKTAVQMIDWDQNVEALHHINRIKLHSSLLKESKVNVIFLGGSMTHGSLTLSACICHYAIDHRCPKRNHKPIDSECNWPTMLSSWFIKKFPEINFNFLNFARTGFTSMTMADTFDDFMRKTSPGLRLTSKDIIFIDHSVNDYFQSKTQIEQGMEYLIRRILKYSKQTIENSSMNSQNSTEKTKEIYSKPTIIVIEQFPNLKTSTARINSIENLPDYSTVYRSISKHYQLMFISMREVFWSYYKYRNISTIVLEDSKNIQEQQRGKKIRVQKTFSVRQYAKDPLKPEKQQYLDRHPPWFIHLYMADLIADTLIHTMSSIMIQQSQQRHQLHTPTMGKLLYDTVDSIVSTVTTLPPPLSPFDELNQRICDNNSPFLIDAHPNSSFTPSDLNSYEQDITVVGQAGWREYIDYHDVPGWIINSLSHPTQRVLSLPIDGTVQTGLLLKVMYLKSYQGMGKARVNICGQSITCAHSALHCGIDGLYPDYETNHVSLPEVFLYRLKEQDEERCAKLPPAERTVDFLYVVEQQGNTSSLSVRGHQKLKLISAALCTMSHD